MLTEIIWMLIFPVRATWYLAQPYWRQIIYTYICSCSTNVGGILICDKSETPWKLYVTRKCFDNTETSVIPIRMCFPLPSIFFLQLGEPCMHWNTHNLDRSVVYCNGNIMSKILVTIASGNACSASSHYLNQNTIIFILKMHLKRSSATCRPFYN